MPKTKRLKSQGWEGVAREAFGEKEGGGKKERVERREGGYHPPTQTLKNGDCACGIGGRAREAFGKEEEGDKTDRAERREGEYTRPPRHSRVMDGDCACVCVGAWGRGEEVHERRLERRRGRKEGRVERRERD